LAYGFLRLRCGECGHDKLLAFSCKLQAARVLPLVRCAADVADGSSGDAELDSAIRRIVQSQTPYPAFPPALVRDYDVIEIRRTWYFDVAVQLYCRPSATVVAEGPQAGAARRQTGTCPPPPVDTVRPTTSPLASRSPPAGRWFTTVPAGSLD
jgi:hypothetical protein